MNMNIFDELNNKLQIIEETKVNLKELERSLCDITKTFKKHNEKEKIDIANYLYWNVEKLSSVFIAKEFFNLSPIKMCKIIEPLKTNIKCTNCDNILICKSRTEYKASQHEKYSYLCKKCWLEKHKITDKKNNEVEKNRRERILFLKNLPYSEYLQTEHWKWFRDKTLKRSNYRCAICNASGNIHVHHRTYINRGNEDYEDVLALCGNCHKLFHREGAKIEQSTV